MNKSLISWISLLFAALLATGCSSITGLGEGEGEGAGGEVVEGAQTQGAGQGGAWSGSALENPDSLLYTKVIYFDFDRSELRPEYMDMLRAHAAYLVQNGGASVTIEGHCDERGSREYNIALGERRAQSVQRFFEAEGVRASQITTISYGEERPEDPGHDEAAWTQNRRAVLIY